MRRKRKTYRLTIMCRKKDMWASCRKLWKEIREERMKERYLVSLTFFKSSTTFSLLSWDHPCDLNYILWIVRIDGYVIFVNSTYIVLMKYSYWYLWQKDCSSLANTSLPQIPIRIVHMIHMLKDNTIISQCQSQIPIIF